MREVAPASLRYQLLQPGPPTVPAPITAISILAGLGGTVAAAIGSGTIQLLFAAPIVAGVVSGIAGGVYKSFPSLQKDPRCVPVGLVPWGAVIDPDRAPEPLRWDRLREVTHVLVRRDRREDQHGARLAIVLFDFGSFRVRAHAEEGEWLAAMTETHRKLARAADCPPASDIEARTPLQADGLPLALALLRRAEAVLASAEGRTSLDLEAGGYRAAGSPVIGPQTREILRAALWKGDAKLDPGPLAAVLTAALGVTSLLPDVLSLITSPSPLLAAVARAAAMRLGASRMAAGSIDELKLFLPEAEIAELRAWSER